MKKRGQAQIITVILIILVVLVVIVIAWNVIRKTVAETSEEIGIEKFSVSLSTSKVNLSENLIKIPVERSLGDGDIAAIRIIFIDESGKSYTYEDKTKIPNELEKITYSINKSLLNLTGNLISFEVYPILLVSGKEIIGLKASGGKVIKEVGLGCIEESIINANCNDSIDNDCDGKTDLDEADCHLGLISWWRFENNTDDEKAINHGTLKGNAQIINDEQRGNVLSVDGSGDYVDCGNDTSLKAAAPKTFLAWVKIPQNTSGRFGSWIASNEGSYVGGGIYIAPPRKPALMSSDGYFREVISLELINLNQWYHIVGLNNGTTAFVYVNGILKKTRNVGMSPALPAQKFGIGAFDLTSGPRRYLNGSIDEVMVFDRALNETEIQAIYDSQNKHP